MFCSLETWCSRAARPLFFVIVLAIIAALSGGGTSLQAGDIDRSVAPGSELQSMLDLDKLAFTELVFVKRKPYSSDHYYTDINNGTSADRFHADNGIYIFDLPTRSERAVVTAADLPGGKGFIGYISLSFDAERILFDFRENVGAGFRIWEVRTDGTGLRQISFPVSLLKATTQAFLLPLTWTMIFSSTTRGVEAMPQMGIFISYSVYRSLCHSSFPVSGS